MHLEAINALAQLIAAIGVILSLFYLAAQIRQNTRSQRSVVVDSLTQSLINLIGPQGYDPELTRAFVSATEDWHGATEEDRLRAVAVLFTTFKLFENAWFQQRQGTLDPEQWEAWDLHIRVYFHRPGVKTWWTLRRAMFVVGFRNYIESTQPISELRPLSELITNKV
ncbi:MAG: hypothetical protein DME74_08455 [Verrucomicrobia bacterium]|nr:MAG: hypothetical protein DME74_08455 [Verrucomicrobiota bacterium]